jgi:uncharacterized protein
MRDPIARYADLICRHSRAVIVVVLLLTAGVGYGATAVDGGFVIAGFETDSEEADAADYVDENFDTGGDTVTTLVVLRDESGEDRALSREALVEVLSLQSEIETNETVAPTLDDEATIGFANVVAFVALAEDAEGPPPEDPSLDEQRETIENRSEDEVDAIVADLLDDPDSDLAEFLPATVDAEGPSAEAQLFVVIHDRGDPDADDLPPALVDAQVAIGEIAEGSEGEFTTFAFGPGIVDEKAGQATGESFALIGPIALVLVLGLLAVAYRDPFDVVLGVAGIALVLAWMAGFVGWLGIEFTQILIAVPFLLIGLSIDYAFHVVMRYREERSVPGADVGRAIRLGLAGVVVAIGATTVTTAIGFFSNLTSALESIRDFGLLSGLGILAAFVVFGALLPAVKYELEGLLESRWGRREKRAFGTGRVLACVLGIGTVAAKRAPVVVVVLVLLVSLGGAYGAANVETSIDENDFLPEERPAWMESVPEPFRPGQYTLQADARYLDATFGAANEGSDVDVLVGGDVTDPAALAAVEEAVDRAEASDVTFRFGDEPAVRAPLDTIEEVAAENESVAAALEAADTTGDGLPDDEVEALFDAAFDADEEAMAAVVAREDGSYEALRMEVTVRGDVPTATVLSEMRGVAAVADEPSGVSAIATGSPILLELVQEEVLESLVTTFAITLALVWAFLTAVFRVRHGSYSLGTVTMAPVLAALSWILGTMYVLEIPYNSETAIITGIAIGIGVDFAIHVSERFLQERATADPIAALSATVTGTGGALLASAATTVAGFGILALTLVPSLQRFGIVTGLTIAFAWVASVLVLPSLLVLWDRIGSRERSASTARSEA